MTSGKHPESLFVTTIKGVVGPANVRPSDGLDYNDVLVFLKLRGDSVPQDC